MKKLSYILIILAFSCQSLEKYEKPKDLIGEDKMVNILTDLALVKAAKSFNKRMLEEKKIDPKQFVFEKYNIDSVSFTNSNNWYASRTEEYERIFKKVKDSLKKYRDETEKLKKVEDSIKKIKDSINRIKKKDSPKEKFKEQLKIPKDIQESIEKAKKKRTKINPEKE